MIIAKFLCVTLFLILFTTYTPNYKSKNKSLIFPIKNIEIINNRVIDSNTLAKQLDFLKGKNIFFINNKTIKSILTKFDFIKGFEVKKIYPRTIKIILSERKPVAIYIDGKKKFYISDKGSLIKYIELNYYNNLPLVFGKNINFDNIFSTLKIVNFPIKEIKSFYYFEIDRWDIILKNDKIIKLPSKDYSEALDNFILINEDENFEKFNTFDYRIKDQLILK